MSEYSASRQNVNGAAKHARTHKDFEKSDAKDRKRSLLYLICAYLRDSHLNDSAEMLIQETQLMNVPYQLCDNIDLDIILQDYQSYYQTKFNKMPKIIKKLENASLGDFTHNKTPLKKKRSIDAVKRLHQTTDKSEELQDFNIQILNLSKPMEENVKIDNCNSIKIEDQTPEWREMSEIIKREIVAKNTTGVGWSDCIGMRDSIEILKEALVYPLKYPGLYTGLLSPWKGVLLYGPPGTGKTHLAKAVAEESSSTFINLTISTFVSKWRGDSEKMLKVLFDMARLHSPSTIFIDELDALASKYEENQHDATRRFKSELLIQLDGLLGGNDQIFILATTNSPWNLDSALLRRFDKRILINIPLLMGRMDIFQYFFGQHHNDFTYNDFKLMAEMTEHFSGADIKLVCKEVLMSILREKLKIVSLCKDATIGDSLRAPTLEDVSAAKLKINPTNSSETIKKYTDWASMYGSL